MSPAPSAPFACLDRPEVLAVLFHPRRSSGAGNGRGTPTALRIPVEDGIHVGARLHMAHARGPGILFFHGNGEIADDYDDIGPLFNRMGINFMVVDYRGYGLSDGSPTVSAMMGDAYRIFDFLREWTSANGYTGPLIVMGRSLGSASALELAAGRADRIDGLVIESGFAWAGPLLARLGVDPQRIGFDEDHGFANTDKIGRFRGPTVIIHAEFDQIIPLDDGEALYAAAAAADKVMVTIPGAGHNDIFMRGLDRYLEAITDLAQKLT